MTLIKSKLPDWTSLTDFFDDDWLKNRFKHSDWAPAVNVVDNEKDYEIEVAAPGLKKEDFNVTVENGILTVSGKTEKEEEEKDKNYTRKEFSSKSFVKNFTLPDNIEEDSVVAKYQDGVLSLVLNKSKKELPQKKEVKIK
ncbi:Hsp20/alpha crystallin family protein [Reichenbachiella sp. MALMAid0571]|uniref:Hsp20/alpha crystallin family protein n=1 Tax=Reichenbachiella sp. MALMAid0571 TaxID=3143939 RepID=UPI0032DFF704